MPAFRSRTCLLGALALATLLLARVATATVYLLPAVGDLIGAPTEAVARAEDTLLDIARHHNVGYEEIRLANPGIDTWLPGSGTRIRLPTQHVLPKAPRDGIVLNLAEMRIYYFPPPRAGEPARVVTHPVSIGRMDWATPLGITRISRKVRNPAWYPPDSVRQEHARDGESLPTVVPPGPDNPLGAFALRLALPGYLIHGTNKPYGIGMRVSHGCVRLYPEDIESLFATVAVGTRVNIIDQPVKAGWQDGRLYVEVHPKTGERQDDSAPHPIEAVNAILAVSSASESARTDWPTVKAALQRLDGLPVVASATMDTGLSVDGTQPVPR